MHMRTADHIIELLLLLCVYEVVDIRDVTGVCVSSYTSTVDNALLLHIDIVAQCSACDRDRHYWLYGWMYPVFQPRFLWNDVVNRHDADHIPLARVLHSLVHTYLLADIAMAVCYSHNNGVKYEYCIRLPLCMFEWSPPVP